MGKNSKQITGNPVSIRQNERGFSLIEVIISMVVFLIVTGAIWGLLRVAQVGRSTVNEQVNLAKDVRLALNVISRDAYNAGYGYPQTSTVLLPDNRLSGAIGIPADYDPSRDTVPPIIAGNNITLNIFNPAPSVKTDQVTFLYKDPTFNAATGVSQPLTINPATTLSGGIDQIVPLSSSNAVCRVNDLYIISGNTGSTLAVSTALNGSNAVQFSNGDILGFNQTGASGLIRTVTTLGTGTTPASMYRVKMVTYYVTTDGILTRREFVNILPAVAFIDMPLVYNVEDFQVQYVMDDGTLSDNPSAGPDGIAGNADDELANLAAVRQIRLTVSVRSYEKNSSGQPFRETMSATVSTRNLGYEAN